MITTKRRKKLYKHMATSIMIPIALLEKCNEVKLITQNCENEYYHVKGTNMCIAHIEDEFCCLVDYMVTTVKNPEELHSLPHMLSGQHFGVYQIPNKSGLKTRDWIMNSSTSMPIGHIIKYAIHGQECKLIGQTMDHEAETWNELDANIQFKYGNINEGSHRRPKFINTMEELLEFINVIREYEKNGGTGFVYKDK